MDRMIYLSMSGAKATMQRQDTLANNLANVSTTGFRAELAAFRAVPVEGSGASTRVYALETTPGYDATPGPVSGDRPQPRRRDEGRRLARRAGARRHRGLHPRRLARRRRRRHARHAHAACTVLGDGGPIQVPPDTEVASPPTARSARTDGNGRQHVDRQAQARHAGGAADARHRRPVPRRRRRPATPTPHARVQDGALEGSNVSAVETMVAMIAAARQFEAQMKMLQTAEGNEKAAAQLLSMS